MEIKAINIIIDEEDFFLSCEVFIGPENENYVYEALKDFMRAFKIMELC